MMGTRSQREQCDDGDRSGAMDGDVLTGGDRRQPTPPGIVDVYRRPLAQPLATLAATLILVVFGWQAYHVAVTSGPLLAVAVIATFGLAYWLATHYWAVQNAAIAATLARRDLKTVDGTDTD